MSATPGAHIAHATSAAPAVSSAVLPHVFPGIILTDIDGASNPASRPPGTAVLSLLSRGEYPALDASLATHPVPEKTLRLHFHDTPDSCLLATLPYSLPFMASACGPVLVHCFAGKSSSLLCPSVVTSISLVVVVDLLLSCWSLTCGPNLRNTCNGEQASPAPSQQSSRTYLSLHRIQACVLRSLRSPQSTRISPRPTPSCASYLRSSTVSPTHLPCQAAIPSTSLTSCPSQTFTTNSLPRSPQPETCFFASSCTPQHHGGMHRGPPQPTPPPRFARPPTLRAPTSKICPFATSQT
jgi:hypothetical protein